MTSLNRTYGDKLFTKLLTISKTSVFERLNLHDKWMLINECVKLGEN